MRLCASYHCKNDSLDEIRYPISMLNTVFTEIVEHPNKTYIIEVTNLQEQNFPIEKMQSLMQEQKNIVVDCYQRIDFSALYQAHLPRCMYHYPVTTYTDLWWVMQQHPYAVTLGEPLVFDLPNVRQSINEHTAEGEYTQIRVLPALGRPSAWNLFQLKDQGMRHFWITPQTLHVYEPYVDVLELYDVDEARESALVKIYASGECKWDMTVLLKNCGTAIPSFMIDDEFAERRLTCRQRCMQHEYSCHRCDADARLTATLIANRIQTT